MAAGQLIQRCALPRDPGSTCKPSLPSSPLCILSPLFSLLSYLSSLLSPLVYLLSSLLLSPLSSRDHKSTCQLSALHELVQKVDLGFAGGRRAAAAAEVALVVGRLYATIGQVPFRLWFHCRFHCLVSLKFKTPVFCVLSTPVQR